MVRFILLSLIGISQLAFAATCETKREIFIENATTKVWKTIICPKQKLPFHSHQFARVVIPATDGQLQVIYRSGRKSLVKLEKDKPLFLTKAQGSESHQDLNPGNNPVQVTVIEFKKSK
ncbi:MAG: hypothetical protein Q8M03_15815 [Legionella sp.]|nr:hypothetical protein [Legionella sp.]